MKMERRKENFKIKLKMPPRGVLYIRKITHWVFIFNTDRFRFRARPRIPTLANKFNKISRHRGAGCFFYFNTAVASAAEKTGYTSTRK